MVFFDLLDSIKDSVSFHRVCAISILEYLQKLSIEALRRCCIEVQERVTTCAIFFYAAVWAD